MIDIDPAIGPGIFTVAKEQIYTRVGGYRDNLANYFVVSHDPGPDCGDGCHHKNKSHQCFSPQRPKIADQNVTREEDLCVVHAKFGG